MKGPSLMKMVKEAAMKLKENSAMKLDEDSAFKNKEKTKKKEKTYTSTGHDKTTGKLLSDEEIRKRYLENLYKK